ncbi:2,3-diaminopropionate biosynthesis protein SbnB [Cohnella sp. GCM10027633]|uniref:2,3-diaminopropionate biosynthesis protein SbnB n=1 Tax=unclassified Cohnella TaxID=2636738 RepID=UPI0036291AC5
MIYLHNDHVRQIGIDWPRLVRLTESIVKLRDAGECASPLKTYLRYQDPSNRIIAMPAYVGGEVGMAGIKWIASFPGNPSQGLPRAHNSITLNDSATGEPVAFIRSGLLSGIRTAAVSGLMMKKHVAARRSPELRLAIIGWGPIGRLHLEMFADAFGETLSRVLLYDVRGIDPATVPERLRLIATVASDWRQAYREANVVATCTVSAARYIDEAPVPGALLLNVSLRDYKPASLASANPLVVVDDWREVCRENTDIEQMHLLRGLREEDTRSLQDVVCRNALAEGETERPIFFNPMGLAVFDISVASHYWREAMRLGVGLRLERGSE